MKQSLILLSMLSLFFIAPLVVIAEEEIEEEANVCEIAIQTAEAWNQFAEDIENLEDEDWSEETIEEIFDELAKMIEESGALIAALIEADDETLNGYGEKMMKVLEEIEKAAKNLENSEDETAFDGLFELLDTFHELIDQVAGYCTEEDGE